MACNPAKSTRNMNGVHCQTSTAMTDSSASFGDAVHVSASVFTPKLFSVPLTAPKFGFSISRHTTPATTGGSINGTSSAARNRPRARISRLSSTASARPSRNSHVSATAA
jgi:hypothetical protein